MRLRAQAHTVHLEVYHDIVWANILRKKLQEEGDSSPSRHNVAKTISRVHEVNGRPPASSYIRHRILMYELAGDFTKK